MKLGHIRSRDARRGVVLLVVLALLTLFAVVAVTFVFFSEQEAVSASLYKDSEIRSRPDADLPFVQLLNQLTLGTNNTESALMMNDLLTNMYGTDGTVPFNGLGRRAQWSGRVRTDTAVNEGRYYQEATHGAYNPPYTYPDENFPALGAIGDPIMRNRIGDPNSLRDVTYVLFRSFVRPVWIRDNSGNPVLFDPYDPTNPDANLFWTNPALSIALPNADATLSADDRRRMVARPGPWDHPFFPAPADAGGDVRNLPPGWTVLLPDGVTEHNGNDSYWIDMGFPVQRGPDGRYYKPLAAVFMMDLDGLMNVNIHGNLFGAGNVALSNHGLGPWEVNLRHVLTANLPTTTTPEWPRVLLGSLNPPLMGRLGSPYTTNGTIPGPFASATSTSSFSWTPTVMPPYYAALDYNASRLAGGLNIPSNRAVFPDPANAARQLERFPRFFPVDGYDTRSNALSNEVPVSHPLFYQHFRPAGDDRVFKAHNMEALLRHGDTNTDAQYSDLRHLLPTNMSTTAYPAQPDTAPGVKARRLLTTHSYDVVRAGVTPWWYRTGNMTDYRYRIEDNNNNQIEDNELHPKGYDDANPGSASIPTPSTVPTYATMEFGNNTWRANIGSWPRLDLNRPLPAYPPVDGTGRIQNQEMFRVAVRARQDFARDIYQRLLLVTGCDPNSMQVEEANARRWLAQLAVNIVDQRDSDDYVTAFNFDTNNNNVNSGWVYGTELPRVVINEVFGQYIQPDPMGSPNDYRTYLWAELYNPLHADPALIEGGDARLFIPETAMGAGDSIRCYRLAILKKSGGDKLRDKDNGLGEAIVVTDLHSYLPNNVAGSRCQVYFDNAPANARVLKPSGNYTTGEDYYHGVLAGGSTMVTDPNTGMMEQRIVPDFSQAWNYGWYMVGPNMIDPGDAAQGQKTFPVSRDATGNDREADGPIPDPLLKENTMSYHLTYQGGRNPNSDEEKPTLILQRLMCPNLPYNDDPTSDLYNNYVTIDYVQNIELHNGDVPAGMAYNAENQYSIGKKQPYASRLSRANNWLNSQYIPQEPGSFPTQNPRNQPKHTFYRHNAIEELYYNEMLPMGDRLHFGSGAATPENRVDASAMGQTLKLPFDWLTHFDREFVSALDLLQVSGYKPFEVLQEFINRDGIPYAHRAPWFANDNRLYRALEFLETRSRAAGVSTRVVRCTTQVNGAPNYRTVSLNTFNQATNPTGDAHWENNGTPADTSDDYVWGFGDNGGIWLVRAGTTLVVEPGTLQGETVRVSAVDAVNQNLTAYFSRNHATSLTDPSGGPNYFEFVVPYMAGRVPGKINLNTIFDFETFAGLLDVQNPNHFVQVSTTTNGAISTANSVNVVTPNNWTMNGPNGVAWSFDIGSVLIVQPGTPNQEIVEVTNIDPTNQTFEAYFTRTHPNNSTIVLDPVATMFRQMVLHRTKQAPFRSLATGYVDSGDYQFEAGLGVEHTMLRPNQLTAVPRSLFELPGNTHPWVKTEAMNKIFNNVTVRSNCFALWVTIGYFEVSSSDSYGTSDVVVNTPPQSRTVTLPNRPADLGISVGSRVIVDTGANIESVDVTAIDNTARTFTAMFTRSHTAPFRIQGSLGREIGRADGKEIRHRYFAIIDRSVFEQFTLEALMRDPVNANISLIRANQRIDPRRDNAIGVNASTFVNLPAPVVYWSRIE